MTREDVRARVRQLLEGNGLNWTSFRITEFDYDQSKLAWYTTVSTPDEAISVDVALFENDDGSYRDTHYWVY